MKRIQIAPDLCPSFQLYRQDESTVYFRILDVPKLSNKWAWKSLAHQYTNLVLYLDSVPSKVRLRLNMSPSAFKRLIGTRDQMIRYHLKSIGVTK